MNPVATLYAVGLWYSEPEIYSLCMDKKGRKIYVTHDKKKAEKHRQFLMKEVGGAFMNPENHYRVVEYNLKEQ